MFGRPIGKYKHLARYARPASLSARGVVSTQFNVLYLHTRVWAGNPCILIYYYITFTDEKTSA